jgi:hypothetical protein
MTDKLIEKLKEITGVSFVSVTYVNQQNEKHQTLFNVGVDYERAKQKDIEYLKKLDVSDLNSPIDVELLEEARVELLNSFQVPSKNRSEGIKNAYTHLSSGLKIHNEKGTLFVYGMKVKKTVLEEGDKKEDTRKPLTKAKDEIRKHLKTSQYRQYEIGRSFQYSLRGDTIMFE